MFDGVVTGDSKTEDMEVRCAQMSRLFHSIHYWLRPVWVPIYLYANRKLLITGSNQTRIILGNMKFICTGFYVVFSRQLFIKNFVTLNFDKLL